MCLSVNECGSVSLTVLVPITCRPRIIEVKQHLICFLFNVRHGAGVGVIIIGKRKRTNVIFSGS